METDREEIIRKAILEKLSAGFDLFTADDILTVAGITNQQLEEIRRGNTGIVDEAVELVKKLK